MNTMCSSSESDVAVSEMQAQYYHNSFVDQWDKYRFIREYPQWARIDDMMHAEERGLTLEVQHMQVVKSHWVHYKH